MQSIRYDQPGLPMTVRCEEFEVSIKYTNQLDCPNCKIFDLESGVQCINAFPLSVFFIVNVNTTKLLPEIKNYVLTERGYFFV